MKSRQVLLLVSGGVVVMLLFLFAQTKPSMKEDTTDVQPGVSNTTATAIDFSVALEKARNTLTGATLDSISNLELSLRKTRGEKEKELMLKSLGEAWKRAGNPVIAATYYNDAASLTNDKKEFENAANLFFGGFQAATDSVLRIYGAQQAANSYRALAEKDSNNHDYLIREAICYIDGLSNVMQGVTVLKRVEAKDPDNREMNLILGRLSIVSGQYDKAIARLEKLTTLDPENAEAFYHLAGAYRAVGRTNDAIKSLEQCKVLVKDPAFDAQIDNYIQQIKKP